MTEQLLLSLKEVAHQLGGVSLSFLYDEITRGKLATVKLGKRRLVAVADLNTYLAAARQVGPEKPVTPGVVDALWDHAEGDCVKCQPIARIGADHGVVFVNPKCAMAKSLVANMILEADAANRLSLTGG